ncbi:MAG: hypothetical protein ACXABY_33020, partial [Candidatus Thorarchaeota archaeon]
MPVLVKITHLPKALEPDVHFLQAQMAKVQKKKGWQRTKLVRNFVVPEDQWEAVKGKLWKWWRAGFQWDVE